MQKTIKKQPSFLPVAALTFVNIIGLTIFIPVLPFIVAGYGAPTWVYGLLLASYPAAMFFGSPILGELSDRIGRKPVLMISQAGTLLSWIILGSSYFVGQINDINVAIPIGILLFARIIDGLTGGNMSVVNAYLADITPRKQLTEAFGKIGAITGFAVVAGPAIGSYASSTNIGYLGMALAAVMISLVTLVLMSLYLNESLVNPSRAKRTESWIKQINILARIKKLKTRPGGKLMLSLNGGFSLVMAGYSAIIALFLIDRFSMAQTQVGNFLLLIGLMLVFNQYVIVPRVAPRLGDMRTFLLGILLLGLGLVLITLTDDFWLYTALYYILNLGLSFVLPTGRSLVAQAVRPERQGEVQGIDESLRAASRAVMPIIMGAIYGIYAYKSFYLLAIIAFLVLVLYIAFGTDRIRVARKFIKSKQHNIEI